MRTSRPYLVAAWVMMAALLVVLVVLAPRQYPLHHDSSANFWYAAIGVNIGATRKWPEAVDWFVDNDRIVYGNQYPFEVYFDLPYQEISLEEAAKDFPAVQRELARRVASGASPAPPFDWREVGYVEWVAATGGRGSVTELIQSMENVRDRRFPTAGSFGLGLIHVSSAARYYWVCFIFEFLYLGGLIWLGFWPFIFRWRARWKIVYVGLVPWFLYLPMWFGYCNSASKAYPLGGIIYPYLLAPAPFDTCYFDWEFDLLKHFPPFLSTITQGRVVTIPDYPTFGYPLPRSQFWVVNVAVLSGGATLLVGLTLLGRFLWRKSKERPRGFPVVIGVEKK